MAKYPNPDTALKNLLKLTYEMRLALAERSPHLVIEENEIEISSWMKDNSPNNPMAENMPSIFSFDANSAHEKIQALASLEIIEKLAPKLVKALRTFTKSIYGLKIARKSELWSATTLTFENLQADCLPSLGFSFLQKHSNNWTSNHLLLIPMHQDRLFHRLEILKELEHAKIGTGPEWSVVLCADPRDPMAKTNTLGVTRRFKAPDAETALKFNACVHDSWLLFNEKTPRENGLQIFQEMQNSNFGDFKNWMKIK